MTAKFLISNLTSLGVYLSADGDQLSVDGPDEALTDELLITIRAHKPALLALLAEPAAIRTSAPASDRIEDTESTSHHSDAGNDPAPTSREIDARPRLGSISRPMPVSARRLIECPYHTCGGDLAPHPHGLYECQTCREWFKLLPPEDLGEGDSHSFTLSGADGYKFVTTPDIRRAAERHRLRAMGDSEVGDDDSASDAAEWVM